MTPLSPLGWLYGLAVNVRNALYDRHFLRVFHPDAKVISIGNLTTGGTGKTPLVALTAMLLHEQGEKVCILTRGYGRTDDGKRVLVTDGEQVLVDAAEGGDEPVELGHKLVKKAAVVADRDRVAAAKWATRHLHTTAFLLDDGFQHRRIARDLDIVCIDATDPFGNGKILPAGKLRESLSNLQRANAIVVTRTEFAADSSTLEQAIRNYAPKAKVFRAKSKTSRVRKLTDFFDDQHQAACISSLGTTFAFCAIGNPKAFFRQLDQAGLKIGASKAFRDHHQFTAVNVREIENNARQNGCDALITTAKDAVRLSRSLLTMPCYVAEMEIVLDDMERFRKLIGSS